MKEKDSVFILASSAIVVVLWILFNIISKFTTPTVSDILLSDVKPIAGSFDTGTLNHLKDRQKVSPLFSEPSPSPTISPSVPPARRAGTPSPTAKPVVSTPPAAKTVTPPLLPTAGSTSPGI